MTKNTQHIDNISNQFGGKLNEQGYAVQYAVIGELRKLERKGSPFTFQVSEFPVEVNEKGIRTDFILRSPNGSLYVVGRMEEG